MSATRSLVRHPRHRRRRIAALLAAGAAAVSLAGLSPLTAEADQPAPRTAAAQAATPALSPMDVTARGADVPFVETEAEAATHNGTLIGPDRTYTTLPSEASGRQAVQLEGAGDYVEFELTEPANAMSVRYALPDNAEGTGITHPAALTVDGEPQEDLTLTSKYGWYYGSYPFTNTPGENPHHFYDETRTMFGETLPAGTKVRISVPDSDAAPWYVVDLADFELVDEPIAQPTGSLSVTDFGADATGGQDSTDAFQQAVDEGAATGKEVYIPEGEFLLYGHVIVDQVTLRGAGPWYSELTGRDPDDRSRAAGIYGKYVKDGGPSTDVTLKDFAILGEITERIDDDQVNAIGGAMSNSLVDNIWMQHTKVGAWMDGPMDDFHIKNSRILDQTADGVNFHQGVTNSSVENTFVRNTGDDALAMWAQDDQNVNNSFTDNTVVAALLANHIAIYGGQDITVTGNVLAESLSNGGGLHVGNRYPGVRPGSTGVSGTFTLSGNTLIRTGNTDYGWSFPIGAVWFDARDGDITEAEINVTDTDIIDSSYSAVQFVSGRTEGVHFEDVNIQGTGTFALQFNDPGEISLQNVTAEGIGFDGNPVYSCTTDSVIEDLGGNSGWNEQLPETYCGEWPDPAVD